MEGKTAFVFPGQGSQYVGMGRDLAEGFPTAQALLAEGSEVLGEDLARLCFAGPEETLSLTANTQPAVLTVSTMVWAVVLEHGIHPDFVVGHSLGEYTALVAAGSLTYSDALRTVRRRGELMQEAVPVGIGAMAALLGLDDDAVVAVCDEASTAGIVEPVNFNSPGQVVIAGHATAVSRAVEYAKEHGARRAIILPVSVPSHSSLMRDAGLSLAETLNDTAFVAPEKTVISAASGLPYTDADNIRSTLSLQVYSPVLWVKTVQAMISEGADTIIECGPGKVLAGLLRRIDKGITVAHLDNHDSLQKALQA